MKQRVIGALIPLNPRFYSEYRTNPDLYGPFWILTTLILTIFIAGNLDRYQEFHSKRSALEEATEGFELLEEELEAFTYNFKFIPEAAVVLYGIGFGLPLVVRFLINCYGSTEELAPTVTTVGIYGYSFASFLITTLLCAIPSEGL